MPFYVFQWYDDAPMEQVLSRHGYETRETACAEARVRTKYQGGVYYVMEAHAKINPTPVEVQVTQTDFTR